MSDDETKRSVFQGVDFPKLILPQSEDSVKAISFHLGDLDITTEMNAVPAFYAAALKQLATADGVIDLVWRLSDNAKTHNTAKGLGATVEDANTAVSSSVFTNTAQPINSRSTAVGSQGVGGWAGLFQFSVRDISAGTILDTDLSDRIISGVNAQADSIKGICTQGYNPTTDGDWDDGVTTNGNQAYWPVELNVMRGIVTYQDVGSGSVFNGMNSLPTVTGTSSDTENGLSAAEHYLNFVGKELTGAATGAQLFDNTQGVLSHLIDETGQSANVLAGDGDDANGYADVSGVQRKIWEAINEKLTDATQKQASSNNMATKMVRYMLDPLTVDSSGSLLKMRDRFFAGGQGSNKKWKRFGPSGGDCSGVMVNVDLDQNNNGTLSHYVDVPLAHGDILEFNLTLTGTNATDNDTGDNGNENDGETFGGQAQPVLGDAPGTGTDSNSGSGPTNVATTTTNQPNSATGAGDQFVTATGANRFGNALPGRNAIRDVVYRIRVHLEGVDTRAAAA